MFQLANAIFAVINDQEGLEEILNDFSKYFWTGYDKMMAEKLGLDGVKESDQSLLLEWQKLMDELKLDYTLFFFIRESRYSDQCGFAFRALFLLQSYPITGIAT